MQDVVCGILTRPGVIKADQAQFLADLMNAYYLQHQQGEFNLDMFLGAVKYIVSENPAFSASQEKGAVIEELLAVPSNEEWAVLAMQLIMNAEEAVVGVYERGTLDASALKAGMDKIAGMVDVSGKPIGDRLKFIGENNVDLTIQREAARLATGVDGVTPTVRVGKERRDRLTHLEGLFGNILFAEEAAGLTSLQRLAAIRMSQKNKNKVTAAVGISAELLKEFGPEVFNLANLNRDGSGYVGLNNIKLAELESKLAELIGIQATSVSA